MKNFIKTVVIPTVLGITVVMMPVYAQQNNSTPEDQTKDGKIENEFKCKDNGDECDKKLKDIRQSLKQARKNAGCSVPASRKEDCESGYKKAGICCQKYSEKVPQEEKAVQTQAQEAAETELGPIVLEIDKALSAAGCPFPPQCPPDPSCCCKDEKTCLPVEATLPSSAQ